MSEKIWGLFSFWITKIWFNRQNKILVRIGKSYLLENMFESDFCDLEGENAMIFGDNFEISAVVNCKKMPTLDFIHDFNSVGELN